MEMYSREWWAERIDLIKAFVDGEKISVYDYSGDESYTFIGNIKDYKIKPKTITVNGFEILAPVRVELNDNEYYYIPSPTNFNKDVFSECFVWDSDNSDKMFLERGLIHLTKENATAHAKAMLGIDPNA